MIIGVDFDNTIVDYDGVFFRRAVDLGLIDDGAFLHKRQVRDRIRLLPEGEALWRKLQAHAYTTGIDRARLIDGVKEFFSSCRRADVRIYIVSHKTTYPPAAFEQIDLRRSALNWMKANGFFDPAALGLNLDQVYFESTRAEKLERIKALNCTHFIDDLQEVLLEIGFPSGVEKILYSSDVERPVSKDIFIANSWEKIHEHFFS